MTFTKYAKIKDSGVSWIGDIPQLWHLEPLKYHVKINAKSLDEKTNPDLEISYIDIGSVHSDGIIDEPEKMLFRNAPSRAKRITCENDTIISTVRTYLKAISFIDKTKNNLICSTGFAVISPSKSIEPKFLYWVLSSPNYVEAIVANSTGVAYPAINSLELGRFKFIFPSNKNEQKQIVNFLDNKIQKIDHEISKNKQLIELLQEKRQSVINNALTNGLDNTVPMKYSGIEWIGKIPEHWNIIKLKFLTMDGDSIKPGPFGSDLKTSDFVDIGYKIYNQKDVLNKTTNDELYISKEKFKKLFHFQVKSGDLLLTSRGSIGKSLIVPDNCLIGIIHPCLIRIRIDEFKINNSYVNLIINESVLFKENIHVNSNGTVIEVIYGKTLKEINIPVPELNEQKQIVEYVDKKTNKIESLISKVDLQIKLLEEFKESLISSAVTGKISITT